MGTARLRRTLKGQLIHPQHVPRHDRGFEKLVEPRVSARRVRIDLLLRIGSEPIGHQRCRQRDLHVIRERHARLQQLAVDRIGVLVLGRRGHQGDQHRTRIGHHGIMSNIDGRTRRPVCG